MALRFFCFFIFLNIPYLQANDEDERRNAAIQKTNAAYAKIRAKIREQVHKMNLQQMKLQDLRTQKKVPTPISSKSDLTINVWSSNCPPCLTHLRDDWQQEKNSIWINIDIPGPALNNAKNFLDKHKIGIIAYYDYELFIIRSLSAGFTLPLVFELKNGKITNWDD